MPLGCTLGGSGTPGASMALIGPILGLLGGVWTGVHYVRRSWNTLLTDQSVNYGDSRLWWSPDSDSQYDWISVVMVI